MKLQHHQKKSNETMAQWELFKQRSEYKKTEKSGLILSHCTYIKVYTLKFKEILCFRALYQ